VEDFGITVSGGSNVTSQTIDPGSTGNFSLTMSPVAPATTFPADIHLHVSGLPAGATYTLTPTTISSGSGPVTVTLTVTVPNYGTRLQPGQAHPLGSKWAPLTLALLLLPFAGRMRRSRKQLGRWLAVLLLLLSGITGSVGLSGCGSGSGFFAQAPQTYIITISGTSGSLTRSTTVTLTVE
jgi:hypothetical protein